MKKQLMALVILSVICTELQAPRIGGGGGAGGGGIPEKKPAAIVATTAEGIVSASGANLADIAAACQAALAQFNPASGNATSTAGGAAATTYINS
jgi:hypothetical protein